MALTVFLSCLFYNQTMLYVSVAIGLVTLLYFIKRYSSGGWCHCKNRLDGKTVIVTGGNSGIGKKTAQLLAEKGARVVLACRDMKRANEAVDELRGITGNNEIVAMHLDLVSFESVKNFSNEFKKNECRLDVLINNAAVFYIPQSVTADGFETVFQTNYLSQFLLTLLLLRKLKESAPSRILNVSSVGYKGVQKLDFDDLNSEKYYGKFQVYFKSKLALILFTRHLAKKLRGTEITVNALHPGIIHTDIMQHIPWVSTPVLKIVNWPFIKLLYKSLEQGSQTSVHCAVSDECAKVSGYYFSDCRLTPLKPNATDDDEAEKLWNISLKLVGLENYGHVHSTLQE